MDNIGVNLPKERETVIRESHALQPPHGLAGKIHKRPRLAPITDLSNFPGRKNR